MNTRNEVEDKMTLLARLAEPEFAKDPLIRPNARMLGAILVAFNALLLAATFQGFRTLAGPTLGDVTPLEAFMGTVLPDLLVLLGGIAMLRGDLRGKRLVALSIPLGFCYFVVQTWQTLPYQPLKLVGMFEIVPIAVIWYGFFYYLVVSSQVGPDPRPHRKVVSRAVLAVAACVVLLFAADLFSGARDGGNSDPVPQASAQVTIAPA